MPESSLARTTGEFSREVLEVRYSSQQNKMGMKQRVAAAKPFNPPYLSHRGSQWLGEPRHQAQRLSPQSFAQQPPTEGAFVKMTHAGGTQGAQALS